MKNLRTAFQRCFVGWLSASMLLAGCGGPSTGAVVPRVADKGMRAASDHLRQIDPDFSYWWFNISNKTNKNDTDHPQGEYVWVTRYYRTNIFLGWFIAGADCVAPGETFQRDIRFETDTARNGVAVKLRAEVKAYGATSCNAPTISDFYGSVCDSNFRTVHERFDTWKLGNATIFVRPPHFGMDTVCQINSGDGPGPPPGVVKHDGS